MLLHTANPKKVYYPATAWYALSLQFFILDRVLKAIALREGTTPTGIVGFSLFKNTGIAFSLPLPPAIFWPVAAAVFAVLLFAYFKNVRKHFVIAGMLFCVILGAVSNLYDRATLGWTTDYLIFFHRSAVNIADGMIIVGLGALAWKTQRDAKAPAAPAA